MCSHNNPNLKLSLREIVASAAVSCFLFILAACTPQDVTLDDSAENVVGTTQSTSQEVSTSTPIPTQTPIPQPTASPTRTAGGAFDRAVELCNRAFEEEHNFTQLDAPESGVYAIVQPLNRSGLKLPWKELKLTGLISEDLIARNIDDLSTIICIRDSLHELTYFNYEDGEAGYSREWELRFIRWPGGEYLGQYTISEFPPFVKVGSGPGIAGEPKADFEEFVHMYFRGAIIIKTGTFLTSIGFIPESGRLMYAYCIPKEFGCVEEGIAFYEPEIQEFEFFPQDGYPREFALSPDGNTLILTRGNLFVWDIDNGQIIKELDTNITVLEIALSPDGQKVVLGGDDEIEVWNIYEGEQEWTLTYNGITVPDVGFVLNSEHLVISPIGDQTLIWNIQNDQEVIRLDGAGNGLAVSADYKIFAAKLDRGDVLVYNVEKNEEVRTISDLESEVKALTFSNNGKWLAIALNGEIQIWAIDTGELVYEIEGIASSIEEIMISPDNKYLAASTWDETIIVWRLPLE